jgi:TRAP-type mannitol/chloroaromatic compound transport system permease small subunit
MGFLTNFARAVDALNGAAGRAVAWLTVATVLICAAVVVLRYAFGIGLIWLQELYVWTHAIVFMLGAGYTLLINGHVRVDIYYARVSPRRKAWLDLIGTVVFLMPWLIVLAAYAIPYIAASWQLGEASSQTGGMPGLYLLKSAILGFCLLVGLQGLAIIARSVVVIAGSSDHGGPADTSAQAG